MTFWAGTGFLDVEKGQCVRIIKIHKDINVLVIWGTTEMIVCFYTVPSFFIGLTGLRVGPKSCQTQCSSGSEAGGGGGVGIFQGLIRKKIYPLP